MKTIFGYIKPYTLRMCFGLIIKIIGTVMDLAIPYLLSYIVDEVIDTGNIMDVVKIGLVMIICAFIGVLGNVIANRMASKVAMNVTRDLRHDLFAKIESLSFSQMDEVTIPSLISRLSSDTYNIHQMVGMMQRIGVRAPILLIGGIIITLSLDTPLALILLATLPLIVIVSMFVSLKGVPLYTNVQKSIDDLIRSVRENASGARVIKALSKGEYEKEKFNKINKKVFDVEMKSGVVMSSLSPTINLILNVGLVLVLVYGAHRVNNDDIKIGIIMSFTSYFTIILNAMLSITRIFMIFSRSSASAARIDYVLRKEPDLTVDKSIVRKPTNNFIEFNNVNFSYNKALNNINNLNFSLKKGDKLGIIGSTGSGKTTLINLLMRFYDVDSGEILINGMNIKGIDNLELKKMFGVVFQNDTIFNDTIYENISFGRNISLEEVKKACDYAQASEFINNLPEGLLTVMSPKGTNVSGGQKQRILIARALCNHPDILIFDDSTSALDYKTDSLVRKAINEHFTLSTTIIITQRVSSIKFCDKIIVLEEGEAIGIGTHEELVETCEVYKEIYKSQMGGDDDE